MDKSMLIGVVAGIGVATAGGVLGYQFLGQPSQSNQQGSALVIEEAVPVQQAAPALAITRDEPAAAPRAPTAAAPRAAQPAPRPAAAPAPRPAPAATQAAAPVEECWDEEVTVQANPKDSHQIAGTAVGAVVGGAIGKDVGDRDLTTVAGAAAGAFIGRKIQQKIQDNRADTRTVTTIERRCAPAGTPR